MGQFCCYSVFHGALSGQLTLSNDSHFLKAIFGCGAVLLQSVLPIFSGVVHLLVYVFEGE